MGGCVRLNFVRNTPHGSLLPKDKIQRETPMARPKTTKTPRKRTAYHHGDLRRALVDAALSLLENDGIDALSLRNVARKIGVSQAAPYAHFKDKHAILEAVATVGFNTLADYMRQYEQKASDLPSTLTAYGVAYVSFAADHPALFKLMFGPELIQRESEEFIVTAAKAYETIVDISRDLLGPDGKDENLVSLHAMSAWSMVHGLANLLVDGKLNDELTRMGSPADLAEAILTSRPPIVAPLKKD